ncbi:hypothetical protein ALC62_08854 [Cyphomyrmex costatus]|uniref:Uncharacterized protein n=1 Tax=Cyphomyrmex costatus TaxID=456900 RepID=A0A195CI28_9HYME|nr:hypothetical protein ALC62_08854 [Cyphomyrmex costatus]
MNLPMNEGSFAEHKVEFSVQSGPRLCNRRGVCQHGHGSLHLRQITARSRKTALGTYFPPPVSLKKVWKPSSLEQVCGGSIPSGCMPCSKQYSSQQALPICTPPWPIWIESTSRYRF